MPNNDPRDRDKVRELAEVTDRMHRKSRALEEEARAIRRGEFKPTDDFVSGVESFDPASLSTARDSGSPYSSRASYDATMRSIPGGGAPIKVAASDDPLLDRYFGSAASPQAPATASPAAAQPAGDDHLLDRYFAPAAAQTAPQAAPTADVMPPGAVPAVPMEGSTRKYWTREELAAAEASKADNTLPAKFMKSARELPGDVWNSITGSFRGGVDLATSGREDIAQGKYGPSFPSSDPRTWEGGGVLKMGAGALGAVTSPVSGTLKEVVEDPVTKLTGNPDIGARAGLVVPGVVGGKIASMAGRALPGVRASSEIVKTVGKENIPEVVSRLEQNPRLALMDVSPGVQTMAQGLAATPGKAQDILSKASKDRGAGARGAVGDAYNELGSGPPPKALEVLDAIKQRAKDTGKNIIDPVVKSAPPADITDLVKFIDAEVGKPKSSLPASDYQRRLIELRDSLRRGRQDRDEMFIDVGGERGAHNLQKDLRAEADTLLHSATGSDRLLGGKLMAVRNKLVDSIDESSQGTYKPALGKYRDDKQVHEAFDRGLNLTRNRGGEAGIVEDSPEAWNRWAGTAHPDELDATKLGALSAIHMKIGSMRNAARAGMDIPESEFIRAKLEVLFGKEKTDSLVKLLRDERDIASTNSKLFQGSQTAARLKGADALKIRDVAPIQHGGTTGFLPLMIGTALGAPEYGAVGSAAMMGTGAVRQSVQRLGRMSDVGRNTEFARLAAATGRDRADLIASLRSRMEPVGKRNKFSDFLTQTVAPALPR